MDDRKPKLPECGAPPNEELEALRRTMNGWQAARAQPAQAVPLLSDEEMEAAIRPFYRDSYSASMAMLNNISEYLAVEQAVRAKMGVAVPMTDAQINAALSGNPRVDNEESFALGVRAAEQFHGIFGEKGGA